MKEAAIELKTHLLGVTSETGFSHDQFHDYNDKTDAFHESVWFVKNCVRSVWVLVRGVPLAIACGTHALPTFLYSCIAGCWYINRAAKPDGHNSSTIAANLHTDPSGKGGTLWNCSCTAFSSI